MAVVIREPLSLIFATNYGVSKMKGSLNFLGNKDTIPAIFGTRIHYFPRKTLPEYGRIHTVSEARKFLCEVYGSIEESIDPILPIFDTRAHYH